MKSFKTNSKKFKEKNVFLNKPFLILMKVFQILGLSTFTQTKITNRYQKMWHLKWSFLNLFAFLIIHFLIFYNHRELFFIGDSFGHFGDFVKVSSVAISQFITLIETIRTQELTIEFFCVYSELHQKWSDARQTRKELKIYKRYFLLMSFYLIVLIVIEGNYLYQIRHKKKWISFFIAYMPSVMICRLQLMQISMYLFLIMTETLQLNNEMLILVKATKNIKLNFMEEMIYKELSVFMRKYQNIYLMMELFKKSFSISFLVIFMKSYIKILSDSYWSYWVIYNQDDVYGKIKNNY